MFAFFWGLVNGKPFDVLFKILIIEKANNKGNIVPVSVQSECLKDPSRYFATWLQSMIISLDSIFGIIGYTTCMFLWKIDQCTHLLSI